MTEKNKGKRLLTLTVALSMTLTLPPTRVFAEEVSEGQAANQAGVSGMMDTDKDGIATLPAKLQDAPAVFAEDGAEVKTDNVGTENEEGGTIGREESKDTAPNGGNPPKGGESNAVNAGESTGGGFTPAKGEVEGSIPVADATEVSDMDALKSAIKGIADGTAENSVIRLTANMEGNISIHTSLTLDLNGFTFSGAEEGLPVITIQGEDTEVTVTSSIQEKGVITKGKNNSTDGNERGNGGGLYVKDAAVVLENLEITENEAIGSGQGTLGGGGIYAEDAVLKLKSVHVTSNTVTKSSNDGGGILIKNGYLTIEKSIISGNKAPDQGGGMVVVDSVLELNSSEVSGNFASYGAGIFLDDSGRTDRNVHTITDTELLNNDAAALGGGIYVGTTCNVSIEGSTLKGNNATDRASQGGAIVCYSAGSVVLNKTTVTDNSAVSGGGILVFATSMSESTITLENGTHIDENEASGYGGGIYLWNCVSDSSEQAISVKLTIKDSSVNGNTSANGAGIFTYGSSPKGTVNIDILAGGKVCDNKTNGSGGGIYTYNHTNLTIAEGAALYNNKADKAADDLFLRGTNAVCSLPDASKMADDRILTADGKEINGWFYDGWYKWNTEKNDWDAIARWAERVGDAPAYYDEYRPEGEGTVNMALKAAHARLYTLTIHYKYENGDTAAEDYIGAYRQAAAYRIESPSIRQYKANQAVVTGVMPEKDVEITVIYRKESSGGGGGHHRPTKPTVDIPDDDALGLNDTDHYAYIVGYGHNDVKPQNFITRAEVAAIFFRLLEDGVRSGNLTHQNDFSDVAADGWYCSSVSTLSRMGIIAGYPDGTFRPNAPITRAEFAAIATRFDNNGDKTPVSFNDITGHWAESEITVAANHGWVSGYGDGTFRPQNRITRAETMSLVNRVLKRIPETPEDLLSDMITWTDNADTSSWYYLPVQEATNSHYYEFKENSKYEKWTALRKTRDWSALG